MQEHGIDALLLSLGADLPWLTGYEAMPLERLTMLVLPADGDATLVVPRLEAPRVEPTPDLFAIRPWSETDDPVASSPTCRPSRRLAISDRTWARSCSASRPPSGRRCTEHRGHRPAAGGEGPHRGRRSAAAAAAADRVATQLVAGEIPLIGRTEADVPPPLRRRLLAEGHDGVNFAIVGSGPNAASPHHEPGGRGHRDGRTGRLRLRRHDATAYCSDITRTVFTGDPPPAIRDLYAVLERAQAT